MFSRQEINVMWKDVLTDLKTRLPDYYQILHEAGWKAIIVDKKARYFGQCHYQNKTVCVNMFLSKHNTKEHIMDTMYHEVAHALDKEIHGRSSSHGKPWQNICKILGCNSKATSKKVSKEVEYPYVLCLYHKQKDQYEFIRGYNRKPRDPLNVYLIGCFLTKRKEESVDNLIIFPRTEYLKLSNKVIDKQ